MNPYNNDRNAPPENTDNTAQLPHEQRAQDINSHSTPAPKKKRGRVLIILFVLLLAGGAIAYFMTKEDKKPISNTAAEPAKTDAKKNKALIYATKLDKTSKVHVKNLDTNTTAEETSFSEPFAFSPDSGNFWEAAKPSADLSHDGTELAYISDNNLIVRNIETEKEETIVKKTGTSGSEDTIPIITIDPAPPKVGGPGLSLISNPVWSRNSKDIGFSLGFYEGGAIQVINRADKSYTSLGDTFRYADMLGIPASKFTLLSENKALATLGIFGDYLVKEYSNLTAATITPDSKSLLAILCPVDLPKTGNSQYLESGLTAKDLAEQKSQRDCGETGDLSLININLTDGSYKEVGAGKFGFSLAQQPDVVYVGGNKASGFNITKISLNGLAPSTVLDVKKLGELTPADTVEGALVKNTGDTPVAEIYIKNVGKQSVKIVNLKTEKLVTTIGLEANTGYTTLGLRQ